MGAASSCCSVETSKQKDLIRHEMSAEKNAMAADPKTPTSAELEQFQANLSEGIDTIVVIADGKKIPCRLKWSASEQNLIISCDVNNHMHIRRMSLNELLTVIHERKDLARVATRANIVEDPACIALHLAKFMKQIKSQSQSQQQQSTTSGGAMTPSVTSQTNAARTSKTEEGA